MGRTRLVALAVTLTVCAAVAGCAETDQGVAADRADGIEATDPVDETDPDETDPDDTNTVAPTTAEVITTTAPTTTLEPTTTTTEPVVTEAPTTVTPTTAAPTTVPFVVPPGAVDLGRQVFLPLPAGYTQTENDPVEVSDGTTTALVQVLVRPPGEDPAVLLQEYIDGFDSFFDAISYTPTFTFTGQKSDLADLENYRIFYLTFDAVDGVDEAGVIDLTVRGDGLNLLVDTFSDEVLVTLPAPEVDAMRQSIAAATLVAEPVPLDLEPRFRVSTAHTVVQVDEPTFLAFTAAPGFDQVSSSDRLGTASNGNYEFEVSKIIQQDSADAAVETMSFFISAINNDVVFEETSVKEDFGTLQTRGVAWNGAADDGTAIQGAFDVFFDPATGNAVSIARKWTFDPNVTEPFAAEGRFMFRSAVNGLRAIP